MSNFAFSISDLRSFNACDLTRRISELPPGYGEDDPIPLSVWWNLPSTSVADMWWSIRCLGEDGLAPAVRAAAAAARRVLAYADDSTRPAALAAIEAAEAWAADPSQANAERARKCASAAASASASAAYAAADAAYAAADAAYAADAASAAASASAAAYAAYAAVYAEEEDQKKDLWREFGVGV